MVTAFNESIQCWTEDETLRKFAVHSSPEPPVEPAASHLKSFDILPSWQIPDRVFPEKWSCGRKERCDRLIGWWPPILLLCPHSAGQSKITSLMRTSTRTVFFPDTSLCDALTTGAAADTGKCTGRWLLWLLVWRLVSKLNCSPPSGSFPQVKTREDFS